MSKRVVDVRAEVLTYRRNTARLTAVTVLHTSEKQAAVEATPIWRRKSVQAQLETQWAAAEAVARAEGEQVAAALHEGGAALQDALEQLAATRAADLLGKTETELDHVRTGLARLTDVSAALVRSDFGAAGAAVDEAERELAATGRSFVVALNQALVHAGAGREMRSRQEDNLAERRQAQVQLDKCRVSGTPLERAKAVSRLRRLQAEGYVLAAEILSTHARPERRTSDVASVGRDNSMRVLSSQECETFADVGGLEDVKRQLAETVGAILDRPDEAARYKVVHNGILFYGPPGTGKNLLSRALAGEYGLRYLRFSPSAIASSYLHEAAANLRQLFELAVRNAPCVLYLDEIDTIAGDRNDQPSADQREVVTQLMVCLEEYREIPGLVIVAATNELDRLDPALREGRFDSKIHVPLPDPTDRAEVLEVHLRRRGDTVDWASIDLSALAKKTQGYNAAALETVVSLAAQAALRAAGPVSHDTVMQVIADRGGQHRLALEETVGWDDVVLSGDAQERVTEILTVFSRPELAQEFGVRPPAGLLLYGPPGTGKTTIAKAMATEVAASFYEMSAADLLSKWAGESEQRVAKLFTKARENRPSIVFIDEIDALLRRRSADSAAKWEERVLSQFLRELDGIRGGDGVLLVGATNRVDTIDEAIVGRRLEPIEIGLPDARARLRLLRLLCRDIKLAKNVDLTAITAATEGFSGADLKRLRDTAGMKALNRAAKSGKSSRAALSVTVADFEAALEAQRSHVSMATV
jgi:transitional endoplasmic reticulum ATPase